MFGCKSVLEEMKTSFAIWSYYISSFWCVRHPSPLSLSLATPPHTHAYIIYRNSPVQFQSTEPWLWKYPSYIQQQFDRVLAFYESRLFCRTGAWWSDGSSTKRITQCHFLPTPQTFLTQQYSLDFEMEKALVSCCLARLWKVILPYVFVLFAMKWTKCESHDI